MKWPGWTLSTYNSTFRQSFAIWSVWKPESRAFTCSLIHDKACSGCRVMGMIVLFIVLARNKLRIRLVERARFCIFSHKILWILRQTIQHLEACDKGLHMHPRSSPNSSWLLRYWFLNVTLWTSPAKMTHFPHQCCIPEAIIQQPGRVWRWSWMHTKALFTRFYRLCRLSQDSR